MSFERNEGAIATLVTTAAAVISLLYNVTHDAVTAVRISSVIIMVLSGAFILLWIVIPETVKTWPDPVSAPHALACMLLLIVGMGKWVLSGKIKDNITRIEAIEERLDKKK